MRRRHHLKDAVLTLEEDFGILPRTNGRASRKHKNWMILTSLKRTQRFGSPEIIFYERGDVVWCNARRNGIATARSWVKHSRAVRTDIPALSRASCRQAGGRPQVRKRLSGVRKGPMISPCQLRPAPNSATTIAFGRWSNAPGT